MTAEIGAEITIPVEYVRHVADQLGALGGDVEGWLGRNGLTRRQLTEPAGVLGYAGFRQLLLDALEEGRDPALGLFVGERLVAASHGIVGTAAVNSSTVYQALEMMERFSRLRSSLFAISHELEAEHGRVMFAEALPLGDLQAPLLEAIVLSVKNVLDEITMGACTVLEVCFPFPRPAHASLAQDLFGCNVRYDQGWAGIRAPLSVLGLPLKLADPTAFEVAELICQRELERISKSETHAARVRRLLLGKQYGFPSLQVTAHLFHMTPRTLHRRLVEEGTSYRQLLESVRHTLAVEHLKSGSFGIDEIAYRLGYTDLSNFRRAFKRWEGVPPSRFRDAHAS